VRMRTGTTVDSTEIAAKECAVAPLATRPALPVVEIQTKPPNAPTFRWLSLEGLWVLDL